MQTSHVGAPVGHLGFRFSAIISASINIFCAKFGTVIENRQPKWLQCSKVRFSKIQDGGRPPSWISILGHNFGVDQHFRTKFGTEMQNRYLKGTHCSEIRFLKIQDGGHHVKSQKVILIQSWSEICDC